MKSFVKHIIKIVFLLILSAGLLDFIFTKVYENSIERNKIQQVVNGDKNNFDVVVLGSSRANNHIVTNEFLKENIQAFNYGMSGSSLEESALLLAIMIEKKWKLKNVLLEVDLNVNSESYSDGTRALFMPYFRHEIISNYYQNIENFNSLYFIPFYRYVTYETKIGVREVFFSLLKRKSNALQNGGFYPLTNVGKNMTYDMSKYSPKANKNYKKIKDLCRIHKINLIVITTPMCKNTINRNYFKELKTMYPEIHNFEDVVTEDNYFSSCGHLNVDGAKIFTKQIITSLKDSIKI
jgi:hypothetical protein